MRPVSLLYFAVLLASAALLLGACAGQNEAVPEPLQQRQTTAEQQAEDPPPPRLYAPLESLTAVSMGGEGGEPEVLELRFDRPGIWSIQPERFVAGLGEELVIEPIQSYGSGKLQKLDLLVLRFVPEKIPGFRLPEDGGSEEFFSAPRQELPLPEAIVLVDEAFLTQPVFLEASNGSAASRRGIISLEIMEDDAAVSTLDPAERGLINELLSLGSAAGSRRGYRSVLFLPSTMQELEAYPQGLKLSLQIHEIPGTANEWQRAIALRLIPRTGDVKPYREVRIGDLGVFSGATPLLDPGIPRISAEVYQSSLPQKMNPALNARFTPVVWEGSFNAYRDERRRFLFYPGIFSYIPGKHPDLSPEDVAKVTGMDQRSFDRALRGRSYVTLEREIYGAIPAFIAAAESPTELEIAFDSNPRLREQLKIFLEQPAYFLLLD